MRKEDVPLYLFRLRDIIKLYHWTTKSYTRHKIADDLYKEIEKCIDKYVEAYLSRNIFIYPKKIYFKEITDDNFIQKLEKTKQKLNHIKYSKEECDAASIRDDICIALSLAIYLSHQV